MAFLTLAEYKSAKGITVTTNDTQLNALINLVCDHIEYYCDRQFGIGGFTNTEQNEGLRDRDGFYFFHVKNTPINSIEFIKVKFYGETEFREIDLSLIDRFDAEGYIRFTEGFHPYTEPYDILYQDNFYYQIRYNGGAIAPGGVRLAAIQAVSDTFDYHASLTTLGPLKSFQIDDYREDYATIGSFQQKTLSPNSSIIMSPTVKDMLAPYRNSGQNVL